MFKDILTALQNNWLSEKIWYLMTRHGRQSKDVSVFIKEQLTNETKTFLLNRLVEEQGWKNIQDEDIRVIKILQWIQKNIKYVSDEEQYQQVEYWAYADDTYLNKKGDCEDGALLLLVLARLSGIDKGHIQLIAGDVLLPGTKDLVGHCWVRYISQNYPYCVFYLDWCYYYDDTWIDKREAYFDYTMPIKPTKSKYKNIWFFADEDRGYKVKQ